MENQKIITVKELREQLEHLERLGKGDAPVWYRDFHNIDHPVLEGIYDTNEKAVVLG